MKTRQWIERSKRSGFTIVELIIVIVVIGILAAISLVSYSGIKQRAENSTIAESASTFRGVVQIASLQNVNLPAGTVGRFCLSDQSAETNTDGTPKCGVYSPSGPKGARGALYNETLINGFKNSVGGSLPKLIKNDTYGPGTVYFGPTLEYFRLSGGEPGWTDERGAPVEAIIHYWLTGENKSCSLSPAVTFDYSASPVPEGQPGARAILRFNGKNSYTDSRVTYCYIPIY